MTLDEVAPGHPMEVASSRADSVAVTRRLAELGVRPGCVLSIHSRTSGGGAILAIGDDRVAVSRRILAGIRVTEAGDV